MHRYIIIYYPIVRLIGPFNSAAEQTQWGRDWQYSNEDNPCWNTINLDSAPQDIFTVKVEHPYV